VNEDDYDWNMRHIVTVFIVGLFVCLLAAGILGGCYYDRERDRIKDSERREQVAECLQESDRSAADCRLAVYGKIGSW
jgi:Mg2+/citrate symporter